MKIKNEFIYLFLNDCYYYYIYIFKYLHIVIENKNHKDINIYSLILVYFIFNI